MDARYRARDDGAVGVPRLDWIHPERTNERR
jgi:hypothetical protein